MNPQYTCKEYKKCSTNTSWDWSGLFRPYIYIEGHVVYLVHDIVNQFKVPNFPMDVKHPPKFDNIFQILFYGYPTLNYLFVYLWFIILDIW